MKYEQTFGIYYSLIPTNKFRDVNCQCQDLAIVCADCLYLHFEEILINSKFSNKIDNFKSKLDIKFKRFSDLV